MSEACGDKDLDIDTISEQLERLEKVEKSLDFESSEDFAKESSTEQVEESVNTESVDNSCTEEKTKADP